MKTTAVPFLAAILISAIPALSPPADAQEVVNVYSTRQPQLIKPILDAFTARSGIETRVVFARKGIVERMALEGARGPADILLTADVGQLDAAVEAGVVQPVSSAPLESRIPAHLRDPEGRWFALTLRARVVFAARDRVPWGVPYLYLSLGQPRWKGRICTRSGRHNYNIALIAAMIAHHGEAKTRDWLKALKRNLARRPQGNDRAQVQAVWAGACDLAIGNSYYMGAMLANDAQRKWAQSVRVVFPRFADGGTHVNISGMAMAASAPNRKNTLKLMAFLVSDAAQKLYADLNHEYPVVAGIAPSPLVASWGAFDIDGLALDAIAARRKQALRLVEAIGFDN